MGLPCCLDGKESACNEGDLDFIPGSRRFPGEGNDNPLHYSCLENSMDRGVWWSMGSQRSDMTEQLTHTQTHIYIAMLNIFR